MENQENVLLVTHFSHEHPLKLTRTKVNATTKITCSCCKNLVSPTSVDFHYTCTIPNCPFALHKLCYSKSDKGSKVNGDGFGLLEMISTSYVGDKSTPSQNFSDSCFSLDLTDSHTNQVVVVGPQRNGPEHDRGTKNSTSGFEKTMSRGSESNMSSKLLLGGGARNELDFDPKQNIQTEAASSKRSSCWPFC